MTNMSIQLYFACDLAPKKLLDSATHRSVCEWAAVVLLSISDTLIVGPTAGLCITDTPLGPAYWAGKEKVRPGSGVLCS